MSIFSRVVKKLSCAGNFPRVLFGRHLINFDPLPPSTIGQLVLFVFQMCVCLVWFSFGRVLSGHWVGMPVLIGDDLGSALSPWSSCPDIMSQKYLAAHKHIWFYSQGFCHKQEILKEFQLAFGDKCTEASASVRSVSTRTCFWAGAAYSFILGLACFYCEVTKLPTILLLRAKCGVRRQWGERWAEYH